MPIQFPSDLFVKNNPYVILHVTKTSAKANARDVLKIIEKENSRTNWKTRNGNTVNSFALPIPNELSDSYSHNFNQDESAVSEALDTLGNKIDAYKGGGGIGTKIFMTTLKAGKGAYKAGQIMGKRTVPNIAQRLPVKNPGFVQNYVSSNPRSFNFSWTLIPESSNDSKNLRDMLALLRKYTSPTAVGFNTQLIPPYFFTVLFSNKHINSLIKMESVVCESMDISYASDGKMSFFHDGSPKKYNLTLAFKETTILVSNSQ